MSRMRLYDSHAHFFTNDIDRYPINTANAHEGADALRQRILTNPSTLEIVLDLWKQTGVIGGAGVQYSSAYKTDNRYTIDCARAQPDLISAVVILDPLNPATPSTLDTMVQQQGVAGLRMIGPICDAGVPAWLESQAALDTWAVADRLHLPVVLMALPDIPSSRTLDVMHGLAAKFPRTKVIFDHAGWPTAADPEALRASYERLRALPNVYMKVTTINFARFGYDDALGARFVRFLVDLFGAERVLWGSDYGNTQDTFSKMVAHAIAAAALLSEDERERFLCSTGRSLFASK